MTKHILLAPVTSDLKEQKLPSKEGLIDKFPEKVVDGLKQSIHKVVDINVFKFFKESAIGLARLEMARRELEKNADASAAAADKAVRHLNKIRL